MTEPILTPETPVSDDEVLYRAVLNESRFFPKDDQGVPRISSMAFNDAGRRPSVDRALLCPGGSTDTRNRFRAGSGVLSLEAGQVRQLAQYMARPGRCMESM